MNVPGPEGEEPHPGLGCGGGTKEGNHCPWMLSAHLTWASSCSCCPSPAVPVPCSPSPLSTGAVLHIQEASQDLLLRGARRGQQVSLCLSQGCHHAMLSIPQQSPGAAGWVPALTPAAEAVQGSLLGWNDPVGEVGPHVYPQCSILSTLHTARASPPSVHSPGTGNVSAGSGWSRDRGGVGSWSSLWLLGSHLHPVGGEAAGYWEQGGVQIYLSAFFFP